MKGRYVLAIAFLSVIINGISLYNLLIAYISLFVMLIVFIPNIFIKIIEVGERAQLNGVNNILVKAMVDSGKDPHPKIIYMIGIIFVYGVGGLLVFMQIYYYDYIDSLVTGNMHIPVYYFVAPYLVGLGYILFITSLVVMAIHFRKIFREAPIFKKR